MQKTSQIGFQYWAIAGLALLPMSMVVMNGSKALQGILSAKESDAQVSSDLAFSNPDNSFQRVTGQSLGLENSQRTQPASSENSLFGVYDPQGQFSGQDLLAIRHFYVSWADFDLAELRQDLVNCEQRGHQVLLTIEPWPIGETKSELLPSIVEGDYDKTIRDIASLLAELSTPTYVSWGHEMDQDLIDRYPWSGQDPQQFLSAYRYVVDAIRTQAKAVRFIWTGVLKKGSLQYWPGKDYADYVGLPIYSFPLYDQNTYGFIRNFETTFREKLDVVDQLDMPLFVTELGVSGSPDFEAFWLREAFSQLAEQEEVAAVVFFYSKDVDGAWGKELPTPDWRVHPDAILGLVEWTVSNKYMHANASSSEL